MAAVLLAASPETLLERSRVGDGLRADSGIEALATLGPELDAQEWQALRYAESEREEAVKLYAYRGGSDFNLSGAEIAALRSNLAGITRRSPGLSDSVSQAYREILMGRHQAYLQGGLEGVEDYQQGGTVLRPAQELAAVQGQAEEFLTAHFPDFWRALSNYPDEQGPEIVNRHYWVKRDVEGRARHFERRG